MKHTNTYSPALTKLTALFVISEPDSLYSEVERIPTNLEDRLLSAVRRRLPITFANIILIRRQHSDQRPPPLPNVSESIRNTELKKKTFSNNCHRTELAAGCLSSRLHVRRMPSSNLALKSGHLDSVLSYFSSVSVVHQGWRNFFDVARPNCYKISQKPLRVPTRIL